MPQITCTISVSRGLRSHVTRTPSLPTPALNCACSWLMIPGGEPISAIFVFFSVFLCIFKTVQCMHVLFYYQKSIIRNFKKKSEWKLCATPALGSSPEGRHRGFSGPRASHDSEHSEVDWACASWKGRPGHHLVPESLHLLTHFPAGWYTRRALRHLEKERLEEAVAMDLVQHHSEVQPDPKLWSSWVQELSEIQHRFTMAVLHHFISQT